MLWRANCAISVSTISDMSLHHCWPEYFCMARFNLSPPASRGESRGCGGARLTRRNARPRDRNPSLQHCPSRDNSIRKAAFKGELSSGASVLRVSVQQFRAVLPSSSGAPPRAEHMARCSDHRGQGPRPGPVPRAPRGLLHPRAVVEGEEAENDSGGANIAPRARPRMRVATLSSQRIDPAGCAAVRPPHTRAVASPPLPCPRCTAPLMPQRRTRPARPLVGLTSSSAAPSAATVEVAAAGAADELVGPKRRRATTLTRHLPTCAGVKAAAQRNATQRASRPPPSRPPPPPLSLPSFVPPCQSSQPSPSPPPLALAPASTPAPPWPLSPSAGARPVPAPPPQPQPSHSDGRPPPQPSPPLLPPPPQPSSPPSPTLPSVGACRRASWAPFRPSSENLGTFWESSHICDEV